MTSLLPDTQSTPCRREPTCWQAVLAVGAVTLGLLVGRWLVLLVWPSLGGWLTGPMIR